VTKISFADLEENTMIIKKQRKTNEQHQSIRTKNRFLVHTVLAAAATMSTLIGFNDNPADAHVSVHAVEKGDTLWSLSQEHDVTVRQVMNANGLTSHTIYIGQKLEMPSEDLPSSALKMEKKTPVKGNLPEQIVSDSQSGIEEVVYTVVSEDTLWSLSQQFGITVQQLKAINNLQSNLIYIGQDLKVPTSTITVKAAVIGAADPHTVEFERNGNFFRVQVPYGTAGSFQELSGEKITISFQKDTLTLISWNY
jgi:LysM repeat protein